MHAVRILRWLLGFANWLPSAPQRRCGSAQSRRVATGLGGSFTASKVDWIRIAYDIPLDCPEGPGFCPSGQPGDGRYSALAAAELLNVNVSTIADWCNAGRLESVRAGTHGPRWITLTPETIAELRKPVQRHWKRRGLVSTSKIWYTRTSVGRWIRPIARNAIPKAPGKEGSMNEPSGCRAYTSPVGFGMNCCRTGQKRNCSVLISPMISQIEAREKPSSVSSSVPGVILPGFGFIILARRR